MWMGCYALDLYCDAAGAAHAYKDAGSSGLIDSLGHAWGEFPHQYTGESGGECRSKARRAGWTIGRNGSAVCPKCNGKTAPSN